MLDPEYIALMTLKAEEVAADQMDEVMKIVTGRLAARLGRGEGVFLTSSDKFQIETLTEAGQMLSDIMQVLSERTQIALPVIQDAFKKAGIKAVDYDASIYADAGISPVKQAISPVIMRVLQRGYEKTAGTWLNLTGTTAGSAYQTFIKACDAAYFKVTSGAIPYTQAFAEAIEEAATASADVVYPTGHRDTLEVATLRALRTGISQTTGEVTATRAAEMDVKCFLTSAHTDPRPEHLIWQGKVYWINWPKLASIVNVPMPEGGWPEVPEHLKQKYPEFVESTDIGTVTGLCGANCRHSYGPFFDGISKNPYESMDFSDAKKRYEISQRQRALERRIRKSKRDMQSLKAAEKAAEDPAVKDILSKKIEAKNAVLVRQNAAYQKFCAEHDLRPLEERLKIID